MCLMGSWVVGEIFIFWVEWRVVRYNVFVCGGSWFLFDWGSRCRLIVCILSCFFFCVVIEN